MSTKSMLTMWCTACKASCNMCLFTRISLCPKSANANVKHLAVRTSFSALVLTTYSSVFGRHVANGVCFIGERNRIFDMKFFYPTWSTSATVSIIFKVVCMQREVLRKQLGVCIHDADSYLIHMCFSLFFWKDLQIWVHESFRLTGSQWGRRIIAMGSESIVPSPNMLGIW